MPTRADAQRLLRTELTVVRTNLRSILDRYWDHEWRRANRHDTSPEDQLWRAATAATEIEAAIDEYTS